MKGKVILWIFIVWNNLIGLFYFSFKIDTIFYENSDKIPNTETFVIVLVDTDGSKDGK